MLCLYNFPSEMVEVNLTELNLSCLGEPTWKIREAMDAEHCCSPSGQTEFSTHNGGKTCSYDEWQIVVNGDQSKADKKSGRRIPCIQELVDLELSKTAKLDECEVIALVLYTGPMVSHFVLVEISLLTCAG